MNPITSAAISVPTTLLVVGSVAGATAQITKSDPMSVKRAVYLTGVAMLVASALTHSLPAVLATAGSVGIVIAVTEPVWFSRQGNSDD